MQVCLAWKCPRQADARDSVRSTKADARDEHKGKEPKKDSGSGTNKSPPKEKKEKKSAWLRYLYGKNPEESGVQEQEVQEQEVPEQEVQEQEVQEQEVLPIEYFPTYGPPTAPYATRSTDEDI